MIFNAGIAIFFIVLGSFRELLNFKGMLEYLVFFTTVLGVFVLRFRSANDGETYRAWTLNPIIFSIISGAILLSSIVSHPWLALSIVLLVVTGTVLSRTSWWQNISHGVETEGSQR
jgi:amino acid transporter